MIRPARPEDANAVAPLIVQALAPGSFQMTESGDVTEAQPVVERFFLQEVNRHSYRNTLVFENEHGVVGSIVCYDGADEEKLAAPINLFLSEFYDEEELAPFWETSAGEYYIDTISVRADQQGKGIAKQLIEAACANGKQMGHARIGLIVDLENPGAKRLYERLDFKTVGHKFLWGHDYEHMQKPLYEQVSAKIVGNKFQLGHEHERMQREL